MDSYVLDRWYLDEKLFKDKVKELGGEGQDADLTALKYQVSKTSKTTCTIPRKEKVKCC